MAAKDDVRKKGRAGMIADDKPADELNTRPPDERAMRADWKKPSGYKATRFMDGLRPNQEIPTGYYTEEEMARKIQKGRARRV